MGFKKMMERLEEAALEIFKSSIFLSLLNNRHSTHNNVFGIGFIPMGTKRKEILKRRRTRF